MDFLTEETILSKENCTILTDDGSGLTTQELKDLEIDSVKLKCRLKNYGGGNKDFIGNDRLRDFFIHLEDKDTKSAHTSLDQDNVRDTLKRASKKKRFVIFVGTGDSHSTIQKVVNLAARHLKIEKRVLILNTSCFGGGLGFFLYRFIPFVYENEHTVKEITAYSIFLGNHISHDFTVLNLKYVIKNRKFTELNPAFRRLIKKSDPSINLLSGPKRPVPIMSASRIGKIDADTELLKGQKELYSYFTNSYKENGFEKDDEVWICYSGLNSEETENSDLKVAYHHAKNIAKHIKKHCPGVKVTLEHRLAPSVCTDLGYQAIAVFYLEEPVRSDYITGNKDYSTEFEEKRLLSRDLITEISRFVSYYNGRLNS